MNFDDDRKVTTFCPRCGKPLVWRATGLGDDARSLEVVGYACYCPLTAEEWADLADQVGEALRLQQQEELD